MESECIDIEVKKSHNFFSPLRYPGGKSCLSEFFANVLSKKSIDGFYIEPYAGGAGAALELLFHERVDKIVINDFDRSIYAIWHSILKNPSVLIKKINDSELTIKEWKLIKELSTNKKTKLIDLGYRTFYLNRTNRSGIVKGGPIGGIAQNGKWKLNARFKKEKLIQRIERIQLYKSRIKIHNLDGIELMNKYKNEENTFIYVDPPYYEKGSSLYHNHYQDSDHFILAKFLNKHRKLNWVLTYDNVAQIRKLYPKRKQKAFNLNYHATSPKIGKEIMIFSDTIGKIITD